MMTPIEVRRALNRLGGDANRIAAALYSLEIKGKKYDAEECPLARYLKKTCRADAVKVDEYCVEVAGSKLATPDACHDFIAAFDYGDYPELEESVWKQGEPW